MSAFLTPDPLIPRSRTRGDTLCSHVGVPVENRLPHRSQWTLSFARRWPGKGSAQMNRTHGRICNNCGHQYLHGLRFGRWRCLYWLLLFL